MGQGLVKEVRTGNLDAVKKTLMELSDKGKGTGEGPGR